MGGGQWRREVLGVDFDVGFFWDVDLQLGDCWFVSDSVCGFFVW